jgi:hypothetical protein
LTARSDRRRIALSGFESEIIEQSRLLLALERWPRRRWHSATQQREMLHPDLSGSATVSRSPDGDRR